MKSYDAGTCDSRLYLFTSVTGAPNTQGLVTQKHLLSLTFSILQVLFGWTCFLERLPAKALSTLTIQADLQHQQITKHGTGHL